MVIALNQRTKIAEAQVSARSSPQSGCRAVGSGLTQYRVPFSIKVIDEKDGDEPLKQGCLLLLIDSIAFR